VLQEEATPDTLAAELEVLLEEGPRRREVVDGLTHVRAALQPPGGSGTVADRVAAIAEEILGAGRSNARAG
jgi:lipid A disaccharide synthetase